MFILTENVTDLGQKHNKEFLSYFGTFIKLHVNIFLFSKKLLWIFFYMAMCVLVLPLERKEVTVSYVIIFFRYCKSGYLR